MGNTGNDGKKSIQRVIGDSAGQAAAWFEAMPPGDDRVGRWIIGVGVQELVEGAEGGQPPVDGGNGVALRLSVGDVAVHLTDGNFVGRFVGPGEELL